MNLKRTVTIVVVCAAFAAWLSSAMTPTWRPPATAPAAPPPIDRSGAALADEIQRLRQRLQPEATPRARVRNPFVFHVETRRVEPPAPQNTAPAAPASTVPIPAPLVLVGLAQDDVAGAEKPVRTAIVSGAGDVFLVKEGESLTVGGVTYKAVAITDDSVELLDTASGVTRRLTLR